MVLDCMILRDEAAFYLTREGPLASKSENYEERPSQIQLTKEIMSAFNRNRVSVFEAGTGVGKSFAYLIPSILWSVFCFRFYRFRRIGRRTDAAAKPRQSHHYETA